MLVVPGVSKVDQSANLYMERDVNDERMVYDTFLRQGDGGSAATEEDQTIAEGQHLCELARYMS